MDDIRRKGNELGEATGKALEIISGPWLGPTVDKFGQLAVLVLVGAGIPLAILWILIVILGPVQLVEGSLLAAGFKMLFGAVKKRIGNDQTSESSKEE